ncbi:unnamed protein product [Lactuca saligna]|uniref:Replication factor A C-terminal domain-containing protein n=1 Tax=Lactuca saligna TaxID=75948 RepID=A0AA35VS14_LACSI|nr:unnamed protein product [Lactuca saligna]
MNIGNKVYLKDIESLADDSHLKLRVLKIWNFIRNNIVLSIEMIVMDEEETKYQSRVFNQKFSRFGHLLKEDQSYIILKPSMAAVKNGFSVTGQRQTITFDWRTIIKRCDDFSGIGQAKSHYDVTKMFINSEIDEINDFKKELKVNVNGGTPEKSITTLPSYASSYIDDFKGDFPLKTILEITEPLKLMKFVLVGKIVNIRQNLHWCYEACYKCGKKINKVPKPNLSYTTPDNISETVEIQCLDPVCNDENFHVVLKYIIPINVQDHTGTIGFTLFDREAKRLLKISASQLKKLHEEAGDSMQLFPNQMNVLKNRKFAFLVEITSYNVSNYNNIYSVVKLTEDVDIVSNLESKLEILTTQSVSLNEVPLESDDVVENVQKDVISQTDESFTPSTVDKSSTTSPLKISTDLKRNLHDIYDVDCGGDMSSTKTKRNSIGEGNTLLVPKLEK